MTVLDAAGFIASVGPRHTSGAPGSSLRHHRWNAFQSSPRRAYGLEMPNSNAPLTVNMAGRTASNTSLSSALESDDCQNATLSATTAVTV